MQINCYAQNHHKHYQTFKEVEPDDMKMSPPTSNTEIAMLKFLLCLTILDTFQINKKIFVVVVELRDGY